MSALLNMQIANLPSLLKGVLDAQKLSLRFMRTEMKRGVQRIKKKFIAEQLKGPPGIAATGRLSKGKNIFTYAGGNTTKDLVAKIGISRILHVHEIGMPIGPKKAGGLLYLHEKGKHSDIIAVVPQVVIPSRLRFRQLTERERGPMMAKVKDAGARGVQVAMQNTLKQII